MNCENCGKGIKRAAMMGAAKAIVDKAVKRDLKRIEEVGLKAWIYDEGWSVRGFAKYIGLNSTTVDSWIATQRLSRVAEKALEGCLMRRAMR